MQDMNAFAFAPKWWKCHSRLNSSPLRKLNV